MKYGQWNHCEMILWKADLKGGKSVGFEDVDQTDRMLCGLENVVRRGKKRLKETDFEIYLRRLRDV